ncbi:LacI family transcriptional regulator [Thiospirochaeta perfilievii]|uniref:LacI family transcriptional regulator n=1 Tax=Thiospirochaeta perfilievii TaxID=252967 RepID=A0A5C1Q9B4_9SPIO|nr:LacI family DNA-binding transcriptional regulator [Thiospirochaeta perfilievii]QEN03680.1 LacI family transcriptional regulator [Thiospirochaeta perfilievii]
MSNKNSNIYDVAKRAGISIATVSRVINTPDKVSSKTKDRVLSAMRELEFTPKAEARERAKKSIGKIGVIASNLKCLSFVHRLNGISTALNGTPYEIVIVPTKKDEDLGYYLSTAELKNNLDGIIVLSQKLENKTLKILKEISAHVVFVEFGERDFSSISIDNNYGGSLVASYLLDRGYRSFSILTEEESNLKLHPNQMRVTGFINQLIKKGINIPNDMIKYSSVDFDESVKVARELLKDIVRPQAIFATTDLLAAATLKAARELEISVPNELAIIGFDGTDTSNYLNLTTVDQSLEQSGKLAVELLLKRIKNPKDPIQNIYLPLKIIERGTVL